MNNSSVSIIIPCYNASKYLPGIVSDLQQQSYKDFEVIFVNDGDHSQDPILEQIVNDDSRFKVVWKENGGASSARNTGIDIAQSEWLIFVDADDRLSTYYVEKLVNGVLGHDVDLGIAGYEIVAPLENVNQMVSIEEPGIFNMADIWLKYSSEALLLKTPWNKIYRSELLKKLNLKFDLTVQRIQDWILNLQIYDNINNVALIDNCGYKYYLYDSTSLCSSYVNNFELDEQRAIDMELALMKKFNLPQNFVEEKTKCLYGLYAYFQVCNLFKRKSPLTLFEAKHRIAKELFGNKDVIDGYLTWKDNRMNLFLKMFYFALKTNSPLFMAIFYKCQYWIKYHFMDFYLFVKPYLKK